jgi:hypothetical protein
MHQAAPIIPYENPYRLEFISRRIGCVILAPEIGGLDYTAACLK